MPNGYDYSKEYGGHSYPGNDCTSNCVHGCGCSAGPSSSHGPTGLDPLGGECPANPKDGKLVGGKADYDIVVTRRIRKLESELYHANKELAELRKIEETPKAKLAEELQLTKDRLNVLLSFKNAVDKESQKIQK